MPAYRVEQEVTLRVSVRAPDQTAAIHDAEQRLRRRLPMVVPAVVADVRVVDTTAERFAGPGGRHWVSVELLLTVEVDAVDAERAGEKARATVASLCADLDPEDWRFATGPAVEPA